MYSWLGTDPRRQTWLCRAGGETEQQIACVGGREGGTDSQLVSCHMEPSDNDKPSQATYRQMLIKHETLADFIL